MTIEDDKDMLFIMFAEWKFKVGQEIKFGSFAHLIALDSDALDYALGDMVVKGEIMIVNRCNFELTEVGYQRMILNYKGRS